MPEIAQRSPTLTPSQQDALAVRATTYALDSGITFLPRSWYSSGSPAPSASVHAPVSILPTPFPRRLFEEAQRIQRIYNILYSRVSRDFSFLDRVMGEEGVGGADEFIGSLWRGWKRIREEGFVQVWF